MANLAGRRIGDSVVLRSYTTRTTTGNPVSRVVVRCACGGEFGGTTANLVYANRTGSLRCPACVARDYAAASAEGWKHPMHSKWQSMIARCYDPNAQYYRHYGGRGIAVCDQWRGSRPNGERATIDGFKIFINDLPPRPSSAHTLDRIDNDGPYSPENCRWATRSQQQNNKRNNALVTVGTHTHTVAEWSSKLGYATPEHWAQQAKKYGVPLDRALAALLLYHPLRVRKWKSFFADIDLYGV